MMNVYVVMKTYPVLDCGDQTCVEGVYSTEALAEEAAAEARKEYNGMASAWVEEHECED